MRVWTFFVYTVRKIIDFPRYNMKCSGENVILHGIFHKVFHYISCYIAEIRIVFQTGRALENQLKQIFGSDFAELFDRFDTLK